MYGDEKVEVWCRGVKDWCESKAQYADVWSARF
jgi:hypothetical protein